MQLGPKLSILLTGATGLEPVTDCLEGSLILLCIGVISFINAILLVKLDRRWIGNESINFERSRDDTVKVSVGW